ncbi:BCCT family transporter [Salmonella enterica]|uniref:BCCT family transporter n=1 Tax=Citrobacter braakii TaxID=57706 RepID=A0A1V8NSM8_CITBR|nr:BCCT family transporter [Citrobacter braakii]EAO0164604.1 BCCT family transporter [Salmonella enterica]EBS3849515.1 BCCT family transporter [Salmonella enterica subsp. enterica serovar Java]EDX3986951.1 BCCT family transporter [Salmonella enterica subsp. enterica serovar 4,[5],12:b:-]EEE5612347.1 BCCT family transporter [Salmonella enterica subsp. enterica serovar Typhimurium]EKN5803787.1 BCCT family transporter [Salmonella enterica subsp. enterica]
MLSNVKKKDVPLIAISLVVILLIATVLSLFPQQSAQAADTLFNGITRLLGSAVQLLVLLILGLVIWLATGRYGNIRLGEGKAEYSTLSWLFMFICAGLGSSTLYWGVVEWAYYYQTPGLNIAPLTPKALEYSLPYSFFHWGVSAWATYTLASLIMAYHFHVRKNNGLSLSGIISAITGVNPQGFWGRLVDLMFLIATVGALTISLVVTAATFTRGLSALTGLPDNFTVQACVILLSGGIFCISSWTGINNGMKRLSNIAGWGAFLLPLIVLIAGPTEFITNNIINSVGLTAQNFLQMSLFTDPLGDGAFTRNWTVFYWLWWISYTPGVAMFVTRVSRGRKIKEVVWALLLGSTAGCWFFFGVMESYAMHQFVNDVINVPHVMQTLGGETVISQVLMSLPAGRLFLAAYLLVMIIFLASHMDAVAYTMAATSTRNLREGEEPERGLRLFWCVVITLIPLSILFTGASLETMKTTVVLTALPFLAILLVKTAGFLRWLRQDYAHVPVHLIETHVPEPAGLSGQLPPGAVLKSDGQSL